MNGTTPEAAEVFRRFGDAFRHQHGALLSTAQRRVMTAIVLRYRTTVLVDLQPTGLSPGDHVEQCDSCGHRRVWYKFCRNRPPLSRGQAIARNAGRSPVPSGWRTADPNG